MKCEVEQIDPKQEEHVMVYCHNREASWVQNLYLDKHRYVDIKITFCIN